MNTTEFINWAWIFMTENRRCSKINMFTTCACACVCTCSSCCSHSLLYLSIHSTLKLIYSSLSSVTHRIRFSVCFFVPRLLISLKLAVFVTFVCLGSHFHFFDISLDISLISSLSLTHFISWRRIERDSLLNFLNSDWSNGYKRCILSVLW